MLFASVFVIVVGVMIIGQWTVIIARKRVPGLEAGSTAGRGPIEMCFHWAAEFITAALLIASGIGLLSNFDWGLNIYLPAIGMLIYTVINSPGYFAQQRKWPMVGMFSIILLLAIISLFLVL
ncbi:MAG: hypothetical protein U9N44_00595 [Chloroflexota bacterium]|nr:hypothetical protein [Chloroflexota bacterium]